MKKLLENILASIASAILKKYKPTIIGITGSAGKTSTKEAIAAALATSFFVRATPKNYNNDLGLPLSIIGGRAAGKNVFGWLAVVVRGWSYILYPRQYPKFLVLEMGSDHPGDLARLVKIAPPNASVITSVGTAHIEFFGSEGAIAEEKETLARVLSVDGFAVLNADDPRVVAMRFATKARVITCGFSESADLRIKAYEYVRDPKSCAVLGMRVTLSGWGKEDIVFDLMGVVGKGHIRAAVSALVVAKIFHVPLALAVAGLRNYTPPPSRLRLIEGVKNTVIIDDTYNASPSAMFEALDVLKGFPMPERARRIALLGDMRELGGITEKEHIAVGQAVANGNIDLFVAIGEAMHSAVTAAKNAGMDEGRIFHLENAVAAGRFLQERIKAGDVILIKGSQNTIRLERAVKELMAEPELAPELICRQGSEWEK